MKCFLLVALFALSAPAADIPAGAMGIASKNTANYRDSYDLVLEAAANLSELLPAPGTEKGPLLEDFKALCGDTDALDSVSWKSSPEKILLSFTCLKSAESVTGGGASFASGEGASFAYGEGAYFTFSVLLKPLALESASQKPLKLAPEGKAGLKVVIGEGLSLVSAVLLAEFAAREIFPYESDKIKHAGGSAGMGVIFSSIAYHGFDMSEKNAALAGAVASCMVGIAKEMADPYIRHKGHRGDRDIRDFYADLTGCLTGYAVTRIYSRILNK